MERAKAKAKQQSLVRTAHKYVHIRPTIITMQMGQQYCQFSVLS